MKNCDNKNKKILRKDKLFLRNSFVILSPKYREYVVAVDIRTGKELSKKEGSLHRMPNGSFWLV